MPRARDKYGVAATPQKAPVKIPLNDDRQEKANRLQSRQALHEMQMNQIKAAVTPLRKRRSLPGGSPRTPGKENDGDGLANGNNVTPIKRVPILANFEEWMKMATDNKINAANSWNFALIDYFHDMSLLKEGDGVNFQKASCTLDGCVKIYTSRVDSVATETGKLLSGLADSGNKKRKGEDGEAEDGAADEGAEDDDGEEGGKKRTRARTQRSSEATLATSFAQLQVKKMELEFAVDPLFKKASADFDEGGARGLLLNNLAIDGKGRIVFDSSDDAQDAAAEEGRESMLPETAEDKDCPDQNATGSSVKEVDVASLASRFFPDLARLDEQDICPSLKNFDLGDAAGNLELPFLKAPEDWRQDRAQANSQPDQTTLLTPDAPDAGFDDDDEGAFGAFDLPPDTGFGDGGEAWAKEAAIQPQMRVRNIELDNPGEAEDGGGEVGAFDAGNLQYAVSLSRNPEADHQGILNYFDQALQKTWAGPEHWRIRRIKDNNKPSPTAPSKRKEKEPFEIDFAAPLSQALADALYIPASSSSAISLSKAQRKSKSRNLLPDDKHFSSRQLLRLFLKPKAWLGSRKTGHNQSIKGEGAGQGEVDEAFWSRKENFDGWPSNEGAPLPDYDANFFQDDPLPAPMDMNDDDDEFADARETFSPPIEGDGLVAAGVDGNLVASQEGAFGTQLVTQSRRLRPEYVQYARVAKKVDVRRLKEEMWSGMGLEKVSPNQPDQSLQATMATEAPDKSLKFTEVINGLQEVYPKEAMADISTSYCFICLLHLANEKGLILNHDENFQELMIRKDATAEIASGAD